MTKSRPSSTAFSFPMLLAGLATALAVHAQPTPASGAASAGKPAYGNKAGKPSVDAAASQSGVATKKPAKQGAQSGAAPASAPKP
jgi:hypothetical protein